MIFLYELIFIGHFGNILIVYFSHEFQKVVNEMSIRMMSVRLTIIVSRTLIGIIPILQHAV